MISYDNVKLTEVVIRANKIVTVRFQSGIGILEITGAVPGSVKMTTLDAMDRVKKSEIKNLTLLKAFI